jgi:hypothetical protein
MDMFTEISENIKYKPTVPVMARFKVCVRGRSFASIAGSNPTGSMDTHLYGVCFVGDDLITPSG